jgi:hypothetical protein
VSFNPAAFLTPYPDPLAGGDRVLNAIASVQQARERAQQREHDQALGWARLAETQRSNKATEGLTGARNTQQATHEGAMEGNAAAAIAQRANEARDRLEAQRQQHEYEKNKKLTELRNSLNPVDNALAEAMAKMGQPEAQPAARDAVTGATEPPPVAPNASPTAADQEDLARRTLEYEQQQKAMPPSGVQAGALAAAQIPPATAALTQPSQLKRNLAEQLRTSLSHLDTEGGKFKKQLENAVAFGVQQFEATGDLKAANAAAQKHYESMLGQMRGQENARMNASAKRESTGNAEDIRLRMGLETVLGKEKGAEAVKLTDDLKTLRDVEDLVKSKTPLGDIEMRAKLARLIGGSGNIAVAEQKMAHVGGVGVRFDTALENFATGRMSDAERQLIEEGIKLTTDAKVRQINQFARSHARVMASDPLSSFRGAAPYAYRRLMEEMAPGVLPPGEDIPALMKGKANNASTSESQMTKGLQPDAVHADDEAKYGR